MMIHQERVSSFFDIKTLQKNCIWGSIQFFILLNVEIYAGTFWHKLPFSKVENTPILIVLGPGISEACCLKQFDMQ